jgi:hypothetical protein
VYQELVWRGVELRRSPVAREGRLTFTRILGAVRRGVGLSLPIIYLGQGGRVGIDGRLELGPLAALMRQNVSASRPGRVHVVFQSLILIISSVSNVHAL